MSDEAIGALNTTAQTISQAVYEGAKVLSDAGVDNAYLDAEVLLRHVLGMGKEEFYIEAERFLGNTEQIEYRELIHRRSAREPVAYITGTREFWSLDFRVTRDVLIPRPETELLVEIGLALAKTYRPAPRLRILDVGTGSGAIAISIANELPNARVTATDISRAALNVARQNAIRHRVRDRIDFSCVDLFNGLANTAPFDFIVSNPPYVRSSELSSISREIAEWEPVLALDGDGDGLAYYRRIASEAHAYIAKGGYLLLEIAANMANDISHLFAETGQYTPAVVYQDCAARDRVLTLRKL